MSLQRLLAPSTTEAMAAASQPQSRFTGELVFLLGWGVLHGNFEDI